MSSKTTRVRFGSWHKKCWRDSGFSSSAKVLFLLLARGAPFDVHSDPIATFLRAKQKCQRSWLSGPGAAERACFCAKVCFFLWEHCNDSVPSP